MQLQGILLGFCVIRVDFTNLINPLDELNIIALVQLEEQNVSVVFALLFELSNNILKCREIVVRVKRNAEDVSCNSFAFFLDLDALARNTTISDLLPLAVDLVGDSYFNLANIDFKIDFQRFKLLIDHLYVLFKLFLPDVLCSLDSLG
jgi:hypothetical protein